MLALQCKRVLFGQLRVANHTVPAVLVWQGCIHVRVCLDKTLIKLDAQFKLLALHLSKPVLHLFLAPFVVARNNDQIIPLETEELCQLLDLVDDVQAEGLQLDDAITFDL